MTLIRHLCRGRQEALSQQCCSWALWQGLISGAVSAKGNPAMFKLYLPADKLADGWALPCHSLQAVGVSNRNEPQRGNLSSGLHLCISEKGMRTTVRETERSAELPAAAALLGAGRKHLNTSGIICCINLWDFFFYVWNTREQLIQKFWMLLRCWPGHRSLIYETYSYPPNHSKQKYCEQ